MQVLNKITLYCIVKALINSALASAAGSTSNIIGSSPNLVTITLHVQDKGYRNRYSYNALGRRCCKRKANLLEERTAIAPV